jgi:hypothetical protein
MSLDRFYKLCYQDGILHTILYWLAVPTLILIHILGGAEVVFDPKPHVIYYNKPELPTDLLPYNEYLLTMKYIMEMEVEVRDAQFA